VAIPKYVPYRGSHGPFSKNFQVLYPTRHELDTHSAPTKCEKAGNVTTSSNERRATKGICGVGESIRRMGLQL